MTLRLPASGSTPGSTSSKPEARKKTFVLDISICNGCYNCQIACKDEHCRNDWMPYAVPQPDIGQFWLEMNENIRGGFPG